MKKIQKNTVKKENLLLLGFRVRLPHNDIAPHHTSISEISGVAALNIRLP
jgi:hypothetical protein